jgi:hypothetical protein
VSLDPIVSLSVALAESPGSSAFLLGSGVSTDAGIPTGAEVRWTAVGDLYRIETGSAETPDHDGLRAWLDETSRGDLGYSDLLELITPDPAPRRDYLAKHFEGVAPGLTHERLAGLAARGVVRVFVTTNFDRLLENALHARGIEPIVVTSDADLDVAPAREHVDCYVLKPHGDYLQQTIRNTPTELGELEPGITGVLQEIFDRYGLVVVGYSGGDEAIGTAVRRRRSRYGLYWVARGEIAEPARSIVEACAGRTIVRAGAAEFLADLDHRLQVFEAHPTGLTPLVVHDEVLRMLKDDDKVSLTEAMRRERRAFEERFSALTAGRSHEQLANDAVIACHDELLSIVERRLASLLPLLLHDRPGFEDEIRAIADVKERQPRIGGYSFWIELLDWCLWVITYSVGATAVRLGRVQYLTVLFETSVSTPWNQQRETFAQSLPGDAGGTIGTSVLQRIEPGNRLIAPYWELLRKDIAASELVRERYPELANEDAARAALVAFDLLVNIGLGVRQGRVAAHWAMYTEQAIAFTRQLAIPRMRAAAGEAVGLSIEDFNAQAPDALVGSHKYGHAFTGSLDAIIATLRDGAIGAG